MIRRLLLLVARIAKGVRGRIRALYFRQVLAHMGSNCRINDGVLITGPENISLGDDVILNEGVILQSSEGATITVGSHVHIAYGAVLITGNLDFSKGWVDPSAHVGNPVVLEDYVVIGARALVYPGVRIGRGSVVAAGSVVTGAVKPNTVVFGNPARPLRNLEARP